MDYKERTISEQTGLYINALIALEQANEKIFEALNKRFGEKETYDIWKETYSQGYNALKEELYKGIGDSIREHINIANSTEF